MRQTPVPFPFVLVVAILFAGVAWSEEIATLEASWTRPDHDLSTMNNFMIVGISDERETRRRFEDKFVSHLRGVGAEGITSYSLVPDLQNIEDRDQLLTSMMEQQVDGVISVRVVALEKKTTDEDWAASWNASMEEDSNLRLLIESTLPIQPTKAKRFGVEISIWEMESRSRVWSGRTDGHKRKELREQAGDLVQQTLEMMKDAGLRH